MLAGFLDKADSLGEFLVEVLKQDAEHAGVFCVPLVDWEEVSCLRLAEREEVSDLVEGPVAERELSTNLVDLPNITKCELFE